MRFFKNVSFIRLAVLPGIIPRIRDFFRSGFSQVSYLLACLYNTMNLLPNGHPYLNPHNIGRYTLRNVIGEAADNLVLDKKHIDKIIMFGVTLIGLALLFMQFFVVALAVIMSPAFAQQNIFVTPTPETDLAFIGLDMVFGVPGIFGSCIETGAACSSDPGDTILQGSGTFPWPFHEALHAMFQLYSTALLVVAVFLIIYFIIAVLAETAQSGTPFGRRFNKVWAPIRLVVALGLLVPLTTGLNSAQYITLYAANAGSSIATNAWLDFNETLADAGQDGGLNDMLGATQLVGKPNPPRSQGFLQFLHVAKACELVNEYTGYRVIENFVEVNNVTIKDIDIEPYLVRSTSSDSGDNCNYDADTKVLPMASTTVNCAWEFFDGGDPVIRIGYPDQGNGEPIDTSCNVQPPLVCPPPPEPENVNKICGEFTIPLTNMGAQIPNTNTSLTLAVAEGYYNMIVNLWDGGAPITDFVSETDDHFVKHYAQHIDGVSANPNCTPWWCPWVTTPPPDDLRMRWVEAMTGATIGIINTAHADVISTMSVAFGENLSEKGWAGASIWYNKIAEINGLFMDSVNNFPHATEYPFVMEWVAKKARQQNKNASGDRYDIKTAGEDITFPDNQQSQREKYNFLYNHVYRYWADDPITGAGTHQNPDGELVGDNSATGNIVIDVINAIFGTAGLFDMRENADVHPLAQLSALGKGIMNSTVSQILIGFIGIGGQVVGGLAGSNLLSQASGVASSFTFSIASIGLTAGFLLYYILPFMPFIYFFFAFIGWIKGIFEAMVGIPLWALAHIRIDGEGLPGDAAINGYFLLLEIVIRPVLIIFGMLASITIFAASVQILNDIFDLVVTNLAGYNQAQEAAADASITDPAYYRGPVDQFFYTVIYAVIVYLLATSSFKLIDTIPNQILRWAGQSVSSFNDQRSDPAEGLSQYVAFGGVQIFGQGLGALQQGGQGLGSAAKGVGGMMNTQPRGG